MLLSKTCTLILTVSSWVIHRCPTRPCWTWMKQEQRQQPPQPSRSCPWACLNLWHLTDPSWSSSWNTRPRASSSWERSTTPQPSKDAREMMNARFRELWTFANFYLSIRKPRRHVSVILRTLGSDELRIWIRQQIYHQICQSINLLAVCQCDTFIAICHLNPARCINI